MKMTKKEIINEIKNGNSYELVAEIANGNYALARKIVNVLNDYINDVEHIKHILSDK